MVRLSWRRSINRMGWPWMPRETYILRLAVNIEFENEITADQARDILREAPGCLVIDKHEDGGYITPYESAGEDATYISRIREDATVENGLNLWVVSDNLRKGAALNAIQIAELLINRGLVKPRKQAA